MKKLFDFLRGSFARVIVFVYLLVIVSGLILYVSYIMFPSFDFSLCLNLKQNQICTVFGLYLTVISSLPGYIIVGTILNAFFYILPSWFTYLLVIIVSAVIYYAIGKYFDKLNSSKNDLQSLTYNLIIGLAFLLLVVFMIMKFIFMSA